MYKPSAQQLDSLIDMIVEALACELEAESQAPLTTNAAAPDQGERGILEKTQRGNHN
jgi:hypothetical protein